MADLLESLDENDMDSLLDPEQSFHHEAYRSKPSSQSKKHRKPRTLFKPINGNLLRRTETSGGWVSTCQPKQAGATISAAEIRRQTGVYEYVATFCGENPSEQVEHSYQEGGLQWKVKLGAHMSQLISLGRDKCAGNA